MSEIARRLTGWSEDELSDYNYSRVRSSKDVSYTPTIEVRQNPRFTAKKIVGNADLAASRTSASVPTSRLLRK